MKNWVIGDVHGCAFTLDSLLKSMHLSSNDKVFFLGDLIGRGNYPLEVVNSVFDRTISGASDMVLGNHDIKIVLNAMNLIPWKEAPTNQDTLERLAHFIASRKTMLSLQDDLGKKATLVHAGIPPNWSLSEAEKRADLLHEELKEYPSSPFWNTIIGDTSKPDLKSEKDPLLSHRYTLNAFTRMRYCTKEGTLEFDHKSAPWDQKPPDGFFPWFEKRERKERILFGHWATLHGITHLQNFIALDTGCVHGGSLSAYCLEEERRVMVSREKRDVPKA